MKSNTGELKVGHAPDTGRGPAEKAKAPVDADGGVKARTTPRSGAGGIGQGVAAPLFQRAPARRTGDGSPPTQAPPPMRHAHPDPAPPIPRFIRVPKMPPAHPARERRSDMVAPQAQPPARPARREQAPPIPKVISVPGMRQVDPQRIPPPKPQKKRRPPRTDVQEHMPQMQPIRDLPQRARIASAWHEAQLPTIAPGRPRLQPPALRAAGQVTPMPDPGLDPLARADRLRNEYARVKLKVTPQTLPRYSDADVIGSPTVLGSAAYNTVYALKLRGPDGAPIDRAFKPLASTETGWVAEKTGIPRDNPQIAMRNIATVDYAEALGFDVVVRTDLAMITLPGARGPSSGPQLGMVMDRARGKPAADMSPAELGSAAVMREITKLQLLDHLTGQGDRHGNNYFVDLQPDGHVKVTGIDNDQCFGNMVKDPEAIRYGPAAHRVGFRGTRLPNAMDSEMADAVNRLTPEKLQAMLGDKLTPSEVNAAVRRLAGVKRHIAGLAEEGLVFHPALWIHPGLLQLMQPESSYFGRDLSDAIHRANARRGAARAPW